MDAGLGGGAAHHADGLTGTLARAGIGLGPLAANRQATQVANATIAFDALEALEVHADFAAQVTFNDVLAVLDGMDNLGELLLRQVLGADGRVNIGFGQDVFGIAGANAIDVAQGDVDALIGGDFNADDTCHRSVSNT